MYRKAKVCHICGGQFLKEPRIYRKVLDHDPVSGKIMGAAHSLCNLTRSGPYHTPIFFPQRSMVRNFLIGFIY